MLPGSFRIKNRHKNFARQSGVIDKRHQAFLFPHSATQNCADIKTKPLVPSLFRHQGHFTLCLGISIGNGKERFVQRFFLDFFQCGD